METLAFANFSHENLPLGAMWCSLLHLVTAQVDTLAFANFSHALMVPTTSGGRGLVEVPVDYTKQPLSHDAEFRDKVGVHGKCPGCFLHFSLDSESDD